MIKSTPPLLTLAECSANASELLADAICTDCRSCVSQISDWNRQTLSELAETEHRILTEGKDASLLLAASALSRSVGKVFCASMLIPPYLPSVLPLQEEVEGNANLARQLLDLCRAGVGKFSFYSFHLCANQARGAHALLLTNYCGTDGGRALLPLIHALEAHRSALEDAETALTAYLCTHAE
ncbi:MAG: hypothetical protein IKC31_03355 [Clostridia bacterium]|nr:hypothetical protein [Clostridia bacterium]